MKGEHRVRCAHVFVRHSLRSQRAVAEQSSAEPTTISGKIGAVGSNELPPPLRLILICWHCMRLPCLAWAAGRGSLESSTCAVTHGVQSRTMLHSAPQHVMLQKHNPGAMEPLGVCTPPGLLVATAVLQPLSQTGGAQPGWHGAAAGLGRCRRFKRCVPRPGVAMHSGCTMNWVGCCCSPGQMPSRFVARNWVGNSLLPLPGRTLSAGAAMAWPPSLPVSLT